MITVEVMTTMTKLQRRYTPLEFETLVACIKPVERWTRQEHRAWEIEQTGFRHFAAGNVTPIEHYWPKPQAKPGPWTRLAGYDQEKAAPPNTGKL